MVFAVLQNPANFESPLSPPHRRRFYWHMEDNGEFPWVEFFSTLLLIGGGAVGMEFWAQWAHKELWHDNELGWALHKSHHEPRIGPFEANDVFAIINAVPAISLIFYGFITPNEIGGLCYGAGLGITLFGMSYMFVHDGLVHKRFPVGPLEQVPYFRRVAVAHKVRTARCAICPHQMHAPAWQRR